MSQSSTPELLTLHAVRLAGLADTEAIAARYRLDVEQTRARLTEFEERGWVTSTTDGDTTQWSLTDEGRAANEAQLAAELDEAGARQVAHRLHGQFGAHDAVVTQAVTLAHLESSLQAQSAARTQLSGFTCYLQETEQALTEFLPRFGGYHRRFSGALFRSEDDPAWLTSTDVDSCRRIWLELHEDIRATLNLEDAGQPDPS